jgi:tryptophan-rich sensory protein
MKTDRIRAVLLFFWVGLTITMNILAEVIPLGGQTTGQVSDRYPTLITPAGYAFSLWALIYAGLAGFAVYQALPRQQHSETLRAIRGPLLVNLAANVAWVIAWHQDRISLSLVAMIALLLSLVTAYIRLDRFPVGSRAETWLVRAPISVYLGWVTVATAVNAAVWLRSLGWDGGDTAPFWAVIALCVVTLVCGAVTLRQQDWAFALTALWALTAIAVQQSDTPSVAATALLAASVIAFAKLMGGLGSGPTRVRPASDTGQRGSLPPRRAA